MPDPTVPLRPPSVNTRYRVRQATVEDAAILARQRCLMFQATGALDGGPEGAELETVAREWIVRELEAGTFFSWVVLRAGEASATVGGGRPLPTTEAGVARATAEAGAATAPGEIVAGGGLQLRPLMPRPGFVRGEPEALVLSVWTDPAHRRQGLATQVVQAMLDWCRARGIRRVTLHASAEGRRIYERLGFRATNEMRLEMD